MLRATEIIARGRWSGKPADVVRLDYDRRTRRRIALTARGGLSFLLDLAKAPTLAAGDGIRLEDGRIVAVEAAHERLLEIACADEHALVRIAWHLGNRHLATELADRTLYIREDHVIADMVMGLGAAVRAVERPFNPEGGAYGHGAVHGHSHGHDHHHNHDDNPHQGHAHHDGDGHHHHDGHGHDHHHHDGEHSRDLHPRGGGDP